MKPCEGSRRETQVGAQNLRGAVLRATTSGDFGAAAEWQLRHPRDGRFECWEWKSESQGDKESWEQSLW